MIGEVLRDRRVLAGLALALLARIAFVLVVRPDPYDMVDSREYDGMARALLEGRGLVDDVGFVRPPLYPAFVALAYALGGLAALVALQIILAVATALGVGVLAAALARRHDVAWPATAVAAVYPWSMQYVGGLASETLFTALAVASLAAIVIAAPSRTWRGAVLAGVLVGITALARANVLVLAPFVAAWWWRVAGAGRATAFAAALGAALLPFMAYNIAAGNGPVLASSGGGVNFYIGNNPDTARLYGDKISDDEWRRLTRDSNIGPAALRGLGCDPAGTFLACSQRIRDSVPLREREAYWYRAGFAYIVSDPVGWGGLELRKLAHYWRPWVDPRAYPLVVVIVSGVSFALLLAFAVVGLLRLPRSSAAFILLVAAGSTLAAVAWQVQLRYRFALLDPLLTAAAASAVLAFVRTLDRYARGVARRPPP